MDRQPIAEPVLIVRRINHGFRLQKISRFINCILRASPRLRAHRQPAHSSRSTFHLGQPVIHHGLMAIRPRSASRTDDLGRRRTMSAIAQGFCGNGRSDGGSRRGFTTGVHDEGSRRGFTTRVHDGGSRRGFTTEGSRRGFTTEVHDEGSPTEVHDEASVNVVERVNPRVNPRVNARREPSS